MEEPRIGGQLDVCLQSLPVSLINLYKLSQTAADKFLDDNVLNRLIVTLLNEQDQRISDKNTKLEVIAILDNVARHSHSTRSVLRLVLTYHTEWFEDNFFIADVEPEKDPDVIRSMKSLLSHTWRIDRSTAKELLNDETMSIEDTKIRFTQVYAVTQFQAITRGFVDRRRLKRYLQDQAKEQQQELRNWSAINIQRVARSYIARKTVVRSYHIRKALSHEVLHIAERYLQGGDVWGFLKEINEELARSNRAIADNEAREDNWASNFVSKVIAQRQAEFDDSWERFPKALAAYNGKPVAEGSLLENSAKRPTVKRTEAQLVTAADAQTVKQTSSHHMTAASNSTAKPPTTRKLHTVTNKITPADVAAANSKHFRSLPGPMVRRAVSTTVRVEVANELNRLVNGEFRSRKLANDIRKVYGPNSDPTPQDIHAPRPSRSLPQLTVGAPSPVRRRKKVGLDGRVIQPVGQVTASHSTDWLTNAGRSNNTSTGTVAVSPSSASLVRSPSTVKLSSSSSSASSATAPAPPFPAQPGNTLLLDIPMGLEDTIERLLHAAALRCFVPDFFQGVTATSVSTRPPTAENEDEEDDVEAFLARRKAEKARKNVNADASYAYQMYLSMPMGLAKMRYEVECRKFSQGTVNKLRLKGLSYLRDVSPVSKLIMCLKGVDAPRALLNMAVDLYIEIRNMGLAPMGGTHKATATEFTKLAPVTMPKPVQSSSSPSKRRDSTPLDSPPSSPTRPKLMASASVAAALHPSSSSHSHSRPSTTTNMSRGGSRLGTDSDGAIEGVGVETASPDSPKKRKKKGYRGGYSSSVATASAVEEDEGGSLTAHAELTESAAADKSEVPGQLLLSLVEEHGVWCDLKASVEDLLLHAAFLVVPHKRKILDSATNGWIEVESAMGNAAFKEHTKDLLHLQSEEERREAVKNRFRAAFILTTPFSLYLKNKRVYTVEDLLSVNLSDLGLPPQLETQIEALLTIVVAKCSNSKLMPVPRDLLSTAQELVTVPMLYDPKFQRSPFDPYGRPPRMQKGGVKVLRRLKSIDKRQVRADQALVDMNTVASSRQVAMHLEKPITLWGPDKNKSSDRKASQVTDTRANGGSTAAAFDDVDFARKHFADDDDGEVDVEKVKINARIPVEGHPSLLAEFSVDSKWSFHIDAAAGHRDRPLTAATTYSNDGLVGQIVSRATPTGMNGRNSALTHRRAVKSTAKQQRRTTASSAHASPSGPDFRLSNIINDAVFKHSYTCTHPRCNQVFSRLYTYKIHLKSHENFAGYHAYKRRPQLHLDANTTEAAREFDGRHTESISLPPVVLSELQTMTL